MTVGRIAACMVALACAYVVLAEGAALEQPPDGLALRLADAGASVTSGVDSPLLALHASRVAPRVLILLDPRSLTSAESADVTRHADAGGDVWLFSRQPDLVLPSLRGRLAARPGTIYTSGGSAPGLTDADGRRTVGPSFVALDTANGTTARPLLATDVDAFRDTNANGVLDAGEPPGPFVVATALAQGNGRIVVVGRESFGGLRADVLSALLPPDLPTPLTVAVVRPPPARWTSPAFSLITTLAIPLANTTGAIVLILAGSVASVSLVPQRHEARRPDDAIDRIIAEHTARTSGDTGADKPS